ncbi:MAG: retropepsin-like aspartic protease family protein [Syntrophobacteraceae bacterium]
MSGQCDSRFTQKPRLRTVFSRPTVLLLLLFATLLFASPAASIEIPLQKRSSVYTLPVRVNGVITLTFVLDSGASEVTIPSRVARALLQAGTIRAKDFLPNQRYMLANGSIVTGARFMIRELEVGGVKIFDVPAVVSSVAGPPLLGQSFLARVGRWEIDNDRRVLILTGLSSGESASGKVESQAGMNEETWLSTLPGAAGGKMAPGGAKLPPSRLFGTTPSGKIAPSR